MRIAVAGGTGVVGSHVVSQVEAGGHEVVVLSRASGVDISTGSGLAERLADVDVVIDCLNVKTNSRGKAVAFFSATTRNLLTAEEDAGVRHHLVLSIVGIDELPVGYYAGKVEQERIIRDSGRPFTVLRATQFHEFAGQMVDRMRVGPVVVAPRMLSAPVAADEVAAALVDLAEGEPRNGIVEIGGPERIEMPDMVRRLLHARARRLLVVPVPLPGAARRARSGALVPVDAWRIGTERYDEWLAAN